MFKTCIRGLAILIATSAPLLGGVSTKAADSSPCPNWRDVVPVAVQNQVPAAQQDTLDHNCFSDLTTGSGHATTDVDLTGGVTPFTVDQPVTACSITSDPDGTSELPGATCGLTANGTVHNTVCGTGTVDISFVVTEPGAGGGTIQGTVNAVPFTSGVGVSPVFDNTETEGGTTYPSKDVLLVSAQPDAESAADLMDPTECTDGFTFEATLITVEGHSQP